MQVLLLMEAMATSNETHLHSTGQLFYELQLQRSGKLCPQGCPNLWNVTREVVKLPQAVCSIDIGVDSRGKGQSRFLLHACRCLL